MFSSVRSGDRENSGKDFINSDWESRVIGVAMWYLGMMGVNFLTFTAFFQDPKQDRRSSV